MDIKTKKIITLKSKVLKKTADNIVLLKDWVEFLIEKFVLFRTQKRFFFSNFYIFTKRKSVFAVLVKVGISGVKARPSAIRNSLSAILKKKILLKIENNEI